MFTCPRSTLLPVADYNVITQPANLLVIVLNVAVNTLPVLALRMILRAVKQRPKVRWSWGTSQPLPTITAVCLGTVGRIPGHSQCPQGPKSLSTVCTLGQALTPGVMECSGS